MGHVIIGLLIGFVFGVVLTLIFRIPVEKKLTAERDALKASAQGAIGKL